VFFEDETCLNPVRFIGFELLTAVFLKSSVFWAIMSCSALKINDVSEEYIASIFMVEGYATKETGVKADGLEGERRESGEGSEKLNLRGGK
jgi:hypothetical protein